MDEKTASEYNFFADETWFCIKALIFSHVSAVQIYCVERGVSINPRAMNTNTVEWFFGDARQMVGGATNKMTAGAMNSAGKKAQAHNAAKMDIVGNNATGENLFGREK